MNQTTRAKALSWPYRRHRDFERPLQEAATAWFKEKNYRTSARYPYILENWEDWEKNLLLPEVADYIKSERSAREKNKVGFPLHKYAHHGLSSQSMLFNLIGPLIVRQDLEPLRIALETSGLSWPSGQTEAYFEFEDRQVFNEDSGQPTSIDLVIGDTRSSGSLFIESKLVERQFGGCSVFGDGDCEGSNPVSDLDACYLHFVGRKYWTKLNDFSFLEGAIKASPTCILSHHYQFFRELIFALALGGSFVLLFDERNPSFYREGDKGKRGLVPFLMSMVPEGKRNSVKSISIQKTVQEIKKSGRHNDWIGEFERKYGMTRGQ